mmetsp:Transcript_91941/g.145413  ORF Transcript_91941/g.145413 Transcript_91941/m.145413 type:complete len:249 (+) Transcript_91941:143-889(+)
MLICQRALGDQWLLFVVAASRSRSKHSARSRPHHKVRQVATCSMQDTLLPSTPCAHAKHSSRLVLSQALRHESTFLGLSPHPPAPLTKECLPQQQRSKVMNSTKPYVHHLFQAACPSIERLTNHLYPTEFRGQAVPPHEQCEDLATPLHFLLDSVSRTVGKIPKTYIPIPMLVSGVFDRSHVRNSRHSRSALMAITRAKMVHVHQHQADRLANHENEEPRPIAKLCCSCQLLPYNLRLPMFVQHQASA